MNIYQDPEGNLFAFDQDLLSALFGEPPTAEELKAIRVKNYKCAALIVGVYVIYIGGIYVARKIRERKGR